MYKRYCPKFMQDEYGNPSNTAWLLVAGGITLSALLFPDMVRDDKRKNEILCSEEVLYQGQLGKTNFEIYGACPDKVKLISGDIEMLLPWQEILNSDYSINEKGLLKKLSNKKE